MTYVWPAAAHADFHLGQVDFPRQVQALGFAFSPGGYTAPFGANIPAQFPTDFSRPAASAAGFVVGIVVPVRRLLASHTRSRWSVPRRHDVALSVRPPGTDRIDLAAKLLWRAGRPLAVTLGIVNQPSAACDTAATVIWLGGSAEDTRLLVVNGATSSADTSSRLAWATSNDCDDERLLSTWPASRPADPVRRTPWPGDHRPMLRRVPWERPAAIAIFSAVRGGGIDCAVFPDSVNEAPVGNALDFIFGTASYSAPFYYPRSGWFARPMAQKVTLRLPLPERQAVSISEPAQCAAIVVTRWGEGRPTDPAQRMSWDRLSVPLNVGVGVIVPGPPTPPAPGQTVTVPIYRTYLMLNEVLLIRADDNQIVEAKEVTVTFDSDSWVARFSAELPYSARDAVMPAPDPVRLIVSINGIDFQFLVERVGQSRRFVKRGVAVSGRGIACLLDAPYALSAAHINPTAMSAQQLIAASLTDTGFALSWGVTDWLVDAEALSLRGTPLAVATHVASAAGAVVAGHWSQPTLRILPRYPSAPWGWSATTPDYVIPSAIAEVEDIEWTEKPEYNVVYLSGVQSGYFAKIKRALSAGDLPAPDRTHPLLTHPEAARQLGTSILAEGGRRAGVRLSLPVLDPMGIIDICRHADYVDAGMTRRGVTRSNSIHYDGVSLRQSVTIESLP